VGWPELGANYPDLGHHDLRPHDIRPDDADPMASTGKCIAAGAEVTLMAEVPTQEDLTDVWGTSPSDIFAVGAGSTVVHFDGARWVPQAFPMKAHLISVRGKSSDDVHAVDSTGSVYHYNGRQWTVRATAGTGDLQAPVWWAGPSDLWAITRRLVLHFDGKQWRSPFQLDSDAVTRFRGHYLTEFTGIWGANSGDLWVTGRTRWTYNDGSNYAGAPFFVRYDGKKWSLWDPNYRFNDGALRVWGTSTNNMVVCSETVDSAADQTFSVMCDHRTNLGWTSVLKSEEGLVINALWGIGGSEVYIATTGVLNSVGLRLWCWDGKVARTIWKYEDSSYSSRQINAVWGTPTSDIFAVGTNGTILRFTR